MINNDNIVDGTNAEDDEEDDYEQFNEEMDDDDLNNNILKTKTNLNCNSKTDYIIQDDITKDGNFLKEFWKQIKLNGFNRKNYKRNRARYGEG